MRFFAVFLLFALILAVTARNVPKLTPEQAAEFNAQQIQNGKRSLQDAVHEWLNPDKVPSSVIRLPANSRGPTLRFITSLSLASLLDSLLSLPFLALLTLFFPSFLGIPCSFLLSPPILRIPNLLHSFAIQFRYSLLTTLGQTRLCKRLPRLAPSRRLRLPKTQKTKHRHHPRIKCLWLSPRLENHRGKEIRTCPEELTKGKEMNLRISKWAFIKAALRCSGMMVEMRDDLDAR